MNGLISAVSSTFRPRDEGLSAEKKAQVQFHRLLALLAAAFAGFFALLQGGGTESAPVWPSVVIGGIFAGLFAASYASTVLRRKLGWGTQILLYGLMGWLVAATALEGFPNGYAAVLLFAYAVFPPMVGVGSRSVQPALGLGGVGLVAVVVGVVLVPAPEGRPLFLLGCMVASGVVEGIAAEQLFTNRTSVETATPSAQEEGPFPSVTENVPTALFRASPEEGIVYANQAFMDLFGFESIEEALKVDLNRFFANPKRCQQLWTKARREGGFSDAEVKLQHTDDSVFTGLLSGTVVYGRDGTVTCYDGAITDISNRNWHEQVLRAELNRLERLFESLPVPMARGQLDEEGNVRIQGANEAFKETFGLERTGASPLVPVPEENPRLHHYRDAEGVPHVEVRRNGSGDEQVYRLHLASRQPASGPPEIYLLYTDITPQKRQVEQIQEAQRESMSRLAQTAEQADYKTADHIQRVGKMARLLAEALGQPPEWQAQIEEAAAFHDVGKICVADQILRKSGTLSREEQEEMKRHASIGPALLSGGESEVLRMARRVARSHHERWDGNGYPDGLEGDEIPLAARIVAVADAFDAMTHDRPYREARPVEQAFAVIEEEAGAQFDPQVSAAALQRKEALAALV